MDRLRAFMQKKYPVNILNINWIANHGFWGCVLRYWY